MKLLLLSFVGLPLATLLWAGLFAFLLTVGLYILRLRRRRTRVAFLPLWENSLEERKASALRSRLQRLISLLISLLLVAALLFALGDPRSSAEEEEAKTIAILLDVSASMATPEGESTRLKKAIEVVEDRISALGGGDRMLLIEMGARPRPLLPLSQDRDALLFALSKVTALDVSSDLSAALALARDALRGRERSEVVVVSDGALPPASEGVRKDLPPTYFEQVGAIRKEPAQNVGIVAFSARRYPLSTDRFEVLIEVQNSGADKAVVDLALFEAKKDGSKGPQLDQHQLTIEPGARLSQSYPNLDQAEVGLIATVARADGVRDSFPQDDIARTLLSPRVPARVLLVGPPNNFLDAALLVDASLTVVRVPESGYPPADEYDVTIFDGAYPKRSARTGAAFYLGETAPLPDGGAPAHFPVAYGEKLEMFGFDTWKKDSPVFRLVDPYDVQVLAGHSLKVESGDVVLGSSQGKPILVAGDRPEGRFLALGFSPRKSDFVLRSAWPLFVVNVLDELFPRGRTDAVLGLRTGTLWRPLVPIRKGEAVVRGPLGTEAPAETRVVPVEDGHAVLFGQSAGFYEVQTKEGESRFAASLLSTAEAELAPTADLKLGETTLKKAPMAMPHVERKPWFWLLAAVGLVSFLEWWTYHRRWTV